MKPKIERFREWLTPAYGFMSNLILASCAVLVGFESKVLVTLLLPVALILAVIGFQYERKREAGYRDLKRASEEAQRAKELSHDALKVALRKMTESLSREIGAWNSETRVTTYCHRKGSFVPLMRHSHSESLKKPGRTAQSDSEGILGLAWDADMAFEIFEADGRKRNKRFRELGMVSEDIAALTFPGCRSALAVRISDNGDNIGALIFECSDSEGLDEGKVDTLLKSYSFLALCSLMSVSRDFFPVFEAPQSV